MLMHKDPLWSIFFGDAKLSFIPALYKNSSEPLLAREPFAAVNHAMKLDNLVFLHQTHSIKGAVITHSEQLNAVPPFMVEGDFIITNLTGLGIGIATADCLPIVIYDSFSQAIAVIHAGWRGTVNGVAAAALRAMQEEYGTKLDAVKVFFGPCAKVCCYSVGDEVIESLEQFSYADRVLLEHNNHTFLDLPLLNRLQLEEYGIASSAFHMNYNECTIGDGSFCSYRRDRAVERQMTVAVLL